MFFNLHCCRSFLTCPDLVGYQVSFPDLFQGVVHMHKYVLLRFKIFDKPLALGIIKKTNDSFTNYILFIDFPGGNT